MSYGNAFILDRLLSGSGCRSGDLLSDHRHPVLPKTILPQDWTLKTSTTKVIARTLTSVMLYGFVLLAAGIGIRIVIAKSRFDRRGVRWRTVLLQLLECCFDIDL